MSLYLRILLDTNILIPLEDSLIVLAPNFAHVVQLCDGRHELVYHQASTRDIARDTDVAWRERTLARLDQYVELPEGPPFGGKRDAWIIRKRQVRQHYS